MNNCLVTKLKGNITNPKLRVLNGIVIEVIIPTATAAFWMTSNKNQSVKVFDSTSNLIKIESLVANTQETISISSTGTYYVVIEDVSAITLLYPHSSPSYGGAADDKYNILYFNDLLNLGCTDSLSFEKVTHVDLNDCDGLVTNNKVTGFHISIGMYGDIQAIGQYVTLTQLQISSLDAVGTIESMLDKMFANGRTSGTLTIIPNVGNLNITYNKNRLSLPIEVTFSSRGWSVN